MTRLCREAGRLEKALEVGSPLLLPSFSFSFQSHQQCVSGWCTIMTHAGLSQQPSSRSLMQVYRGMRARKFKPSNAEFRELTSACAEQALKEGQSSALPGKVSADTYLPSPAMIHPLLSQQVCQTSSLSQHYQIVHSNWETWPAECNIKTAYQQACNQWTVLTDLLLWFLSR